MSHAAGLGFDPGRLARIDAFLQRKYVDAGLLPCAQFVLMRHGEIAHRITLGSRNLERDRPCEEDTLFRIYSMTKPLTSVALMMLVEEAQVALDDPVARFLPEWEGLSLDGGLPLERPMLVVDLLRHTAGLTYDFQHRTAVDAAYRRLKVGHRDTPGGLAGLAAQLADLPLEFSPGEAWNYSVATDIVGLVVERAAGQPFQDVLRDRVLRPLGMTDTGFVAPDADRDRFAACYLRSPDGRLTLQDDPETSPFLEPPSLYSGGGGLVGTADDYLRFCRMMLNGGELDGVRLLSPATVRLMTANHLPGGKDLTQLSRSLFSESTYAGVGFGLGFAVVIDPPRTLLPGSPGEYFWGGMASTAFWIDPVKDLAAVFMTQLMPSSSYPVRRELRTLVYSALRE